MKEQMMSRISKIFEEAFDSGGAGSVRECVCGRTHFDDSWDSGWDWEEGELEELRKFEEESPDKFVSHDCAIGCMVIDNKEFVYDCECGLVEKYERFIIHHEMQLRRYLNKRKEMMTRKLEMYRRAKKL